MRTADQTITVKTKSSVPSAIIPVRAATRSHVAAIPSRRPTLMRLDRFVDAILNR